MRKAVAWLMLGLTLWSGIADARILVVYDHGEAFSGNETGPETRGMELRQNNAVYDVLNAWGVDYKLVPLSVMKTEWLRTGTITWNLGTAGANTESFDGIIMLNPGAQLANGAYFTTGNKPWPGSLGCVACSLTVGGVTKAPLVPHLWLFGAMNAFSTNGGAGASGAQMYDRSDGSGRCSTGVNFGEGSVGIGAVPRMMSNVNTGTYYISAANGMGFFPNSTPPTGGFRKWIQARFPHSLSTYKYTHIHSANADTTMGTGDTLVMWERPFTGLYQGAGNTNPIRPIVFANIMGASQCFDSVGRIVTCEFDAGTTLMALARLDSLTGGKVFQKGPRTAAIVVSGGLQHTRRSAYGGIPPDDSTVLKATIDSLNALNVPLTVTVATDSLDTYPNEATWWKGLTNGRFVPTVPTGSNPFDSSRVAGNWTTTAPYDVYGRFRRRAFYGDSAAMHTYAGVSSDSSIYQGLLQSKAKLLSYGFRLSKTIVAPFDDWTPKNMRYGGTANPMDSLTQVFHLAGYDCALTDVQRPEANIQRNKLNRDLVQGWDGKQFVYRNGLTGNLFRFVGHTGYSINGSQRDFMYHNDSTSVPLAPTFGGGGPTFAPVPFQMVGRFWHGFVHQQFTDVDWFPYDGMSLTTFNDVAYPLVDSFSGFYRSSVMKLHVSDLGGIPNGPPTRPGYWAIKSLVREFNAINKTAWPGHTVVRLGYPDEIVP